MSIEYPFFSARELRCRCGCGLGLEEMDERFMERLISLRMGHGKALPVTSAIRCPAHNTAVGGAARSAHLPQEDAKGHAVDLWVADVIDAEQLLNIAKALGFTGRGARMHGSWSKRLIHLDDVPSSPGRPRPAFWTYT